MVSSLLSGLLGVWVAGVSTIDAFEFEDEDDAVEREDIDYSHESQTEETTSNWSPGEDETKVFQPEEIESEPDRKVRQNCSSCDKKFEVELPPGIDAARTACPHCGSIESISLG
jgi:predicted RNA-binding Zn-ribbon protein involved in translation (DUF1610 family)